MGTSLTVFLFECVIFTFVWWIITSLLNLITAVTQEAKILIVLVLLILVILLYFVAVDPAALHSLRSGV